MSISKFFARITDFADSRYSLNNVYAFQELYYISQRSNIEEVVETGAGENNVHFCHLLGILKLAWYPKSRSVGTIWWADLSSTK